MAYYLVRHEGEETYSQVLALSLSMAVMQAEAWITQINQECDTDFKYVRKDIQDQIIFSCDQTPDMIVVEEITLHPHVVELNSLPLKFK